MWGILKQHLQMVSDALDDAHVAGFGTKDVSNAWGRIGIETAGNALIAGLAGGNIGSVAASTAAGDVATIATRQWAESVARSMTDDADGQRVIENVLSNVIGAGAGAAAGAASGGDTTVNALSGAGYASAIQQYNEAHENEKTVEQKDLPTGYVGTSSIDNPKVIHHVYSEYNGEDYDLVGGAGAPVRDDKGNVIFRQRETGEYFVFVNNKKEIPEINGVHTGHTTVSQHSATITDIIDPDTNKSVSDRVKIQTALNDLYSSHLSYLVNQDGTFIGERGTGNAQIMPSSSDPNTTAETFARQAFGGQVPSRFRPLTVKNQTGGWAAIFADGMAVTYRPAGAASFRTKKDMATVEINTDSIRNIKGGNLKFKFPKD
ncbi:hypothetical protein [Komagataeibacter rhaeticus]|nr:hypothetical protein [Komagataeibacter rhaeticus]